VQHVQRYRNMLHVQHVHVARAACTCCTVTRSRVQLKIMTNITWSCFD